jgi:hypothetical protein
MCVHLAACINSAPTGFSLNLIWETEQKSLKKIQIQLKLDTNIELFTWRPKYLYVVDSNISHHKINLLESNVIGLLISHFRCSVSTFYDTCLRPEFTVLTSLFVAKCDTACWGTVLPVSVHLIWIRLMSYGFTVPSAMWCSAITKAASFFCLIIPNTSVLLTLQLGQVTLCGKCTCLQQEKLSEISEHRHCGFTDILTCPSHLLCRVAWHEALKFYLLLLPWHSRSLRQWC